MIDIEQHPVATSASHETLNGGASHMGGWFLLRDRKRAAGFVDSWCQLVRPFIDRSLYMYLGSRRSFSS